MLSWSDQSGFDEKAVNHQPTFCFLRYCQTSIRIIAKYITHRPFTHSTQFRLFTHIWSNAVCLCSPVWLKSFVLLVRVLQLHMQLQSCLRTVRSVAYFALSYSLITSACLSISAKALRLRPYPLLMLSLELSCFSNRLTLSSNLVTRFCIFSSDHYSRSKLFWGRVRGVVRTRVTGLGESALRLSVRMMTCLCCLLGDSDPHPESINKHSIIIPDPLHLIKQLWLWEVTTPCFIKSFMTFCGCRSPATDTSPLFLHKMICYSIP